MSEEMSKELIRELQKLYEDGQYLQIVRRLYRYDPDEIPEDINIPRVTEAITHTFHTSSNQEEIFQADVVLARLKHRGYLNQDSLIKIFEEVSDAFLNARGNKPFFLDGVLFTLRDESWSENLIRLYIRASTREAKVALVSWIGSFYKEQALLVLVDSLYWQKIISNDSIREILEKYSLLAHINFEQDECDAIISAVVSYLEIPGPKIEDSDDEKKYEIESINRTSAARILVVLNGYSKTSEQSRARIRSKGNVIVTYHCADRMYDAFVEIPLSRYLSRHVR